MKYFFDRYPKMICQSCCSNTLDSDGNKVTFSNVSISGGFISIHELPNSTIVTKEDHNCYVNNILCWAGEARFGGIVIQIVT